MQARHNSSIYYAVVKFIAMQYIRYNLLDWTCMSTYNTGECACAVATENLYKNRQDPGLPSSFLTSASTEGTAREAVYKGVAGVWKALLERGGHSEASPVD